MGTAASVIDSWSPSRAASVVMAAYRWLRRFPGNASNPPACAMASTTGRATVVRRMKSPTSPNARSALPRRIDRISASEIPCTSCNANLIP